MSAENEEEPLGLKTGRPAKKERADIGNQGLRNRRFPDVDIQPPPEIPATGRSWMNELKSSSLQGLDKRAPPLNTSDGALMEE